MPPETLPRLKAPREHGQLLVHPPLDAVPALLEGNRAELSRNNPTPVHAGRATGPVMAV